MTNCTHTCLDFLLSLIRNVPQNKRYPIWVKCLHISQEWSHGQWTPFWCTHEIHRRRRACIEADAHRQWTPELALRSDQVLAWETPRRWDGPWAHERWPDGMEDAASRCSKPTKNSMCWDKVWKVSGSKLDYVYVETERGGMITIIWSMLR